MAQYINVERVTENSELLSAGDFNVAEIVNLVWSVDSPNIDYPWLSTIDPYGLTYINHPQKEPYLKDLSQLSLASEATQILQTIEKFHSFILETKTHEYVRLTGD